MRDDLGFEIVPTKSRPGLFHIERHGRIYRNHTSDRPVRTTQFESAEQAIPYLERVRKAIIERRQNK